MRIGGVLRFAVGAVVGYFIVFFFADLLWVRGSAAALIVTFIIAPVGGLASGMISAYFVRGAAVFATATVIGYLVLAFGWVAFAQVFGIADREGSKGMGVIFIIAPVGGAMIGLIAAAMLARRDGPAPPAAS